jgi:(p)ppGpp synthase/HD superfamily hydrolase
MPEPLSGVTEAFHFAALRHGTQERKGQPGVPQLAHLAEVADLVARTRLGADPLVIAAAVLHDVLEDTGTSSAELAGRFGPEVADFVVACTDDPALSKPAQKEAQVAKAPSSPDRVKLIKLADKTSNLRALTTRPPESWPEGRRAGYVAWTRRVAAGLHGVDAWLDDEFERAAAAAEAHFGGCG